MKKVFLCLAVIMTALIFNFSLCFAQELNIEDYLSESKSICENKDLIVYSNYGYTEKEMVEIVNSSDKQCLFFEKDINPINGYNLFGAIDNICFSYKMNYDETTTYDFDTLKKDCNDYFLYVLSASRTNNICDTDINSDFVKYSKTILIREKNIPYGYIDVEFKFYYSKSFINNTGLVLVESKSSFVCGNMAASNNSEFDKSYYQYSQYAHLSVDKYQEWDDSTRDYRTTLTPVIKDYWPVNKPMAQTISSSFNLGLKYGYSYNNGFSTSDGISIGNGYNNGTNIGFTYNKSYTDTLPSLSVQRNADNYNVIEWTYSYDESKKAEKINSTNNACQYLLFEVNGNSCFRTDFVLNYEFDAIYAQRNDRGYKLGTRELKFSNTKQIGNYYL